MKIFKGTTIIITTITGEVWKTFTIHFSSMSEESEIYLRISWIINHYLNWSIYWENISMLGKHRGDCSNNAGATKYLSVKYFSSHNIWTIYTVIWLTQHWFNCPESNCPDISSNRSRTLWIKLREAVLRKTGRQTSVRYSITFSSNFFHHRQ